MAKKHRVHLIGEEQEELKGLVAKGREAAYRQTHARILLLCDENQYGGAMRDADIARALKVGTATVERVRRRCVEEGVDRALGRKEQANRRPRKLDGEGEAQLTALVCSQPGRPETRDQGLGRATKPRRNPCHLAFHHSRCTNQTQVPIPINTMVTAH